MSLDQLRTQNFASREQAAEFLGVDVRTVGRAIDAGQLPAVKVGNRVLVPVPGLLALLEAPQAPPAPVVTGLSPDVVRAAVDMIAAGLRVLGPLLDAAKGDAHRAELDRADTAAP